MRLVPLRCTKCGADIVDYTEGAGVVRCSALGCGATFLLEQGKSFAKSNAIEVKAIANLRKNLAFYQSMRNYQQLADTANAILKLVPEDFLAQFYARLAEKHIGDPRGYRAFLENPPSATPDEYEEAARSVLEQLEIDEEPYAVRYLQKAIPDRDSQMEWTGALTKAVETLRQKADHYALYPRDVFISYSHFDVALARQVVQCLEGDGVSCWVSYRNLANADNENYWHAIRYAIEHCKAFLVICSERAMYSKDVQRELNIAEEARSQPKRLEIKADGKEHTTLFKFFFDG
ncbi:MAG: TIR domain-containing protein, partial [Clostridia bacterium]|nr:TIR domain-containing protein [Clostridia bacterium]